MTSSICIRLPDDMIQELDFLANTLERSKTYIVKKAINQYLEEYKDYLIALERLNDKDDEVISGDKLREQLGL